MFSPVSNRILLVDDNVSSRDTWALILRHNGVAVEEAANLSDALALLRTSPVAALVTDIRMNGDRDGIELASVAKRTHPRMPVIVYSGFMTSEDLAETKVIGVDQCMSLPIEIEDMLRAVCGALDTARQASIQTDPPTRADAPRGISSNQRLIAASPAMQGVLHWVNRTAVTELPVLLIGESGVGKELVARAIHTASPRNQEAFVPVNCGAIPPSLVAPELFGYAKGAFTGAATSKSGLVEEAHRGTLFLDEIGELPLEVQPTLLRFLGGGELRRLGETKIRHSNARVVSATNRPLLADIADARFRQDLYYRLNVLTCAIPPLRERLADLDAFAHEWARNRPKGRTCVISPEALAQLRQHDWPGNLRELQNVLERAAVSSIDGVIGATEVDDAIRSASLVGASDPSSSTDAAERRRLLNALDEHRWHIGRTAENLNIDRVTLWRRMRRFKLKR